MDFAGKRIFCIGIKGTGLSTLAVMLENFGASVSGCDSGERFPTDEVLEDAAIPVSEGFGEELLPADCDAVIYSDAYRAETCPVLGAAQRSAAKVFSYPRFLALLTRQTRCFAVCGTHGKTTTAAGAAYLLSRGLRKSFPFFSIFGSNIIGMGPVFQGKDEMLLEACEYRDHFLLYKVRGALVTSIEMDHPDWFENEDAVFRSFCDFVGGIDNGGFLILCVDSPRVKELALWAKANRGDLELIEYGFKARSAFRLRRNSYRTDHSGYGIDLLPYRDFDFPVYSDAIVSDYFGSTLLASAILLDRKDPKLYFDGTELISDEILGTLVGTMLKEMESFPGVRGRSEVMIQDDGCIYMDDYAHHPTEIRACLENLRRRYPRYRLCVAFRPHTFSRTEAMMNQFIDALSLADVVVVQKTYASARGETAASDNARILADRLEDRALKRMRGHLESAVYIEYDEDAAAYLAGSLGSGGVCVSLGAGNNSRILNMVSSIRKEAGR